MRNLKYREAISEGLVQTMEADASIFVTGISVNYSSAVFGTVREARERFPERVISSPAMENGLTGIAIGAAAMGMRPIIVHERCDFAFLAMDQLINLAAKWRYMYGCNAGSVPIVVRMIIGRGWGQGATHSQSIQSILAHFPGLQVVMPALPHEAKFLLIDALKSEAPTVILEHRSLFETEGPVDDEFQLIEQPRIGKGRFVRIGKDITIVASSFMVREAMDAAYSLLEHGVEAEIIDIQSIRPLDESLILNSVSRTGRLLVCDTSHELCGFASEVCALVAEKAFASLKCAPRRLTLPDCPAPVAHSLEQAFYPRASTIAALVLNMLGKEVPDLSAIDRIDSFKGPY